MATYNLGQAAIVSKGAYDAGVAYLPLNSVTHRGGSWICKAACTGIEPGVNANWQTYWVASSLGILDINVTAGASAGTATAVITFSDGSTTSFTYDTTAIAANSISTNMVQNGAITSSKIASGAVSTTYAAIVSTDGWTQYENYATITLSVSGLLASDAPIVDLDLTGKSGATLMTLVEAWANIIRVGVDSSGNFYIYSTEIPSVDLPIKILCIRK